MAAALVLYLRGATINTMVLAGLVIAVGVVVDDAIIDIENIVRRLRQHRGGGSRSRRRSIVLEASLEVRSADRLRDADRRRGGRARSSSWRGCPGRSSSRSRCPTRWRCWPRWWSR